MKKGMRAIAAGVLGLIVVVMGLLGGCGGGVSNIDTVTGLAKIAPAGTEVLMHLDMGEMRTDGDLSGILEEMDLEFSELGIEGINYETLDYFWIVMTSDYADELYVLGGTFDTAALGNALDEEFTRDEYRGVGIWAADDGAIAIYNSLLIFGSDGAVTGCLDVIAGAGTSAYDGNPDIRDVINRNPSGLINIVAIEEGFYETSAAMAMSIYKQSRDTARMSGSMKFGNEADAAEAAADMESDMDTSSGVAGATVDHRGLFVDFSAEMSMEDIGLFW